MRPTHPVSSQPNLTYSSEEARTLSLLHEISQELNSILDREKLLERVSGLVRKLIDFQVFGIYLWDRDQEILIDSFARREGLLEGRYSKLTLGQGVCGTAAALRRPMRVGDVRKDPRFLNCDPMVGIRSELAVPMLAEGRLLGVINLESVKTNAFTAWHEKILQTLAASLAIALENARLYEELRHRQKKLECDLETARRVQKGLLPTYTPLIDGLEVGSGYRPARHLGGDFYDFLSCGPGNLTVAVGDVAGKSTPAALLGSLSIGILRSHLVEHPCSPAQTLRHMNAHLLVPNLDNRFLAMTLASYNRTSRLLSLANAGLPRPILARKGKISEVPADGFPLGLFPDVSYDEQSVQLHPGDIVVFCSDGLHESMDHEDREYGKERLGERLLQLSGRNATDIAQGLLDASLDHTQGNNKHEDDRTVVVLKAT